MQARYRGEPCQTTLSIAWSNSGELQIELIQQQDDTPSIFTEFLDARGPGLHQLAYWTSDFDDTMRAVEEAAGRWCGQVARGTASGSPTSSRRTRPRRVIEISELTDATAANAMFIHDAAAEWDGSDPHPAFSAA